MEREAPTSVTMAEAVGVVVIGRNEGERLRRCLGSLKGSGITRLVYVDSGSTDGSVALARSMRFEVHELDTSAGFTMARGRNAGFAALLERYPDLRYVQFVDGDCEVEAGWIEKGRACLDAQPQVGAVAGRRRERHPEASVYNLLADIEWDQPVGLVKATGGDVMMRVEAFREGGGFNGAMIAGEEAEMFIRVRARGWRVCRLGESMTLHDAAMTRLGQWWRRTRRTGHAYAEGFALHGGAPEFHNRREVLRTLLWAGLMPLLFMVSAGLGFLVSAWWWLLAAGAVLLHVVMFVKIGLGCRDDRGRPQWWYAWFILLGRYPELLGILTYVVNRVRGKTTPLIEYHSPPAGVN